MLRFFDGEAVAGHDEGLELVFEGLLVDEIGGWRGVGGEITQNSLLTLFFHPFFPNSASAHLLCFII